MSAAADASAATATAPTASSTAQEHDSSNSEWQQALRQTQDAAEKERMALERRYHLRVVAEDAETRAKTVALFLSLSDPDLPEKLRRRGLEWQVELPAGYPDECPRADFGQWNSWLTSDKVSALNAAFRARAGQLQGTLALRKLLTWIDNNIVHYVAQDEAADGDSNNDTADAALEGVSQPIDSVSSEKKAKRKSRRRPCRYFARGKCATGDECPFAHVPPKPKTQKPTKEGTNELTTGAVSAAEPKQTAAKAETPHKDKNPRFCKFFARNKCREGDNCKFSHERRKSKKERSTVPAEEAIEAVKSEAIDLEQASKVNEAQIPTIPATNSNEWTEAQQQALDLALKTFPATMEKKERWNSIAEAVEGRSLNECIDRFKYLSQLVRKELRQKEKQPEVNKLQPVSPSEEEMPALTDEDIIETQVHENSSGDGVVDSRLIPQSARVPIDTEPAVRGAQIRLDDLFLYEIGTVIPHRLVCQVVCANCPLQFDAVLSLDHPEIQKWCPRCSALHEVTLRPVFAHTESNIIAYIDTSNCTVVDVLPSEVVTTCLGCGNEVLMEKLVPGRRSEKACFTCHVKLAMLMKRYIVGNVTMGSSSAHTATSAPSKATKAKKERRVVETFELGKPLPRNGACDHYKHSYRWFRFQCCGKAFPCDVCHDSSDCSQANMGKIASRMICGMCSREQSSQVKVCSCGNEVGRKSTTTRHWEGGKGCRNQTMMASTDKQKFRGLNKTESKKFKRVGAEAKARRTSTSHSDSESP